jgi:hypothetical protein
MKLCIWQDYFLSTCGKMNCGLGIHLQKRVSMGNKCLIAITLKSFYHLKLNVISLLL